MALCACRWPVCGKTLRYLSRRAVQSFWKMCLPERRSKSRHVGLCYAAKSSRTFPWPCWSARNGVRSLTVESVAIFSASPFVRAVFSNRQPRNRTKRGADKCPVHSVHRLTKIVRGKMFLFFAGRRFPPSRGGVIVVGAGINHAVRLKVLRKINVRARIAKAELQHLHAGNAQPLTQRVDLFGDQSQIFGDKR